MDFHFSPPLPPHPCASVNTGLHPFLSIPLSSAEGRQYRRDREGDGKQRGEERSARRDSSLSPVSATYDSCVIRLINEIIDHLMGLIMNCFFALSGLASSSSSPSCCFTRVIQLTGEMLEYDQEHPDCSQGRCKLSIFFEFLF